MTRAYTRDVIPTFFSPLSTEHLNEHEDTGVKSVDIALTRTKDEVFGGELSAGPDASPL
jgi:hypothetical protein